MLALLLHDPPPPSQFTITLDHTLAVITTLPEYPTEPTIQHGVVLGITHVLLQHWGVGEGGLGVGDGWVMGEAGVGEAGVQNESVGGGWMQYGGYAEDQVVDEEHDEAMHAPITNNTISNGPAPPLTTSLSPITTSLPPMTTRSSPPRTMEQEAAVSLATRAFPSILQAAHEVAPWVEEYTTYDALSDHHRAALDDNWRRVEQPVLLDELAVTQQRGGRGVLRSPRASLRVGGGWGDAHGGSVHYPGGHVERGSSGGGGEGGAVDRGGGWDAGQGGGPRRFVGNERGAFPFSVQPSSPVTRSRRPSVFLPSSSSVGHVNVWGEDLEEGDHRTGGGGADGGGADGGGADGRAVDGSSAHHGGVDDNTNTAAVHHDVSVMQQQRAHRALAHMLSAREDLLVWGCGCVGVYKCAGVREGACACEGAGASTNNIITHTGCAPPSPKYMAITCQPKHTHSQHTQSNTSQQHSQQHTCRVVRRNTTITM